MKKYLILLLLIPIILYGQPTKSTNALDEWAAVAQNTVSKGASVYVGGSYDVVLHIAIALTSATSHDGTKVKPQIYTGNNWAELTPYMSKTGTANPEPYAVSASAGDLGIQMASTTGLYDDDETRYIFTLDNTVADSELHILVSHSANDSVTVLDGLENAHTNADTTFDIAYYRNYPIPFAADSVRIIYDNTFDVDGARVHRFAQYTKVTGI